MSEARTRQLVLGPDGRSKGKCETCFWEKAEQLHHRFKAGQGGPWSASNCLGVGPVCHHRIEHDPLNSKRWGLWLEPEEDGKPVIPAKHPARLSWLGWVYLDDDGGSVPRREKESNQHPPKEITL